LIEECKKMGGCTTCTRKGSITKYHIGKCNKESPFANEECGECEED